MYMREVEIVYNGMVVTVPNQTVKTFEASHTVEESTLEVCPDAQMCQ